MITSFTKTISQAKYSELQSTLKKGEDIHETFIVPLENGTSTEIFKLTVDDTTSTEYTVIPLIQSSVVSDEGKVEHYTAVVYNRSEDIYKKLSNELISDSSVLPTLIQAFYKGEPNERHADYEYHFYDGDRYPAVRTSSNIERLDDEIYITAISKSGGHFPQIWELTDNNDEKYILRERSGRIKLKKQGVQKPLIQIFVGLSYPGVPLSEKETIQLLSSIEGVTVDAES